MKGQIAIFRIRCLLFIVLLAFSPVTINIAMEIAAWPINWKTNNINIGTLYD